MRIVTFPLACLSQGALVDLMALAGALGASCHKSQAAIEPAGPQAPTGQVWLTPAQISDDKIEVQTLTSGAILLSQKL
jgi:hypothetical protein